MAQPINRYKADLRDFRFVLFELFNLGDLLGQQPFADWGPDEANMVLDEAYRFTTEVTGPLNAIGDAGCAFTNGKVTAPPGFKDAWQKLYELGLRSLSVPPEWGGQGAPSSLTALVTELLSGSNTAFEMYAALTVGAADVIESFGTEEQRALYCRRMFTGQWAGTMCLTEAGAGSDVGMATTSAKKNPDGSYSIKGTKVFISGGDHDLTENIIHLALARIEGAQKGTKGLSLFIIPKLRVGPNGELGEPNDVKVGSIEHKMGINGSSTCVLNFGEEDRCRGFLVGGQEHQGMKQMFLLMNFARLGVGIQGLAVASTAYLNALDYAKERRQGSSIQAWKDPDAPRAAIIEHPDVRRMLLDMKARVEGLRALVGKGAAHADRARAARGRDAEQVEHHSGQLELLTPIIKAYCTDQSFRICELAIQTLGGVGYTRDFPVEQYCRDSKIFSIYEGTNHIQSLDLVGRKLGQRGGANFRAFLGDIQAFVARNTEHPELGGAVKTLAAAQEAVAGAALTYATWLQAGELAKVPLTACAFLELMGELTVGWLLLESAVIAGRAQQSLAQEHPDWAFYEGKRHVARYWASNVLAAVPGKAQTLRAADPSPLSIPDAAFATV